MDMQKSARVWIQLARCRMQGRAVISTVMYPSLFDSSIKISSRDMCLQLSISEVDYLGSHSVPSVPCLFLGSLTPCKEQNCSFGITVAITTIRTTYIAHLVVGTGGLRRYWWS